MERDKSAPFTSKYGFSVVAHYKSSGKLGHGVGYKYAHDYPDHYVEQQYLPDGLTDRKFYVPGENGYEKKIREYFKKIKGEPEEE